MSILASWQAQQTTTQPTVLRAIIHTVSILARASPTNRHTLRGWIMSVMGNQISKVSEKIKGWARVPLSQKVPSISEASRISPQVSIWYDSVDFYVRMSHYKLIDEGDDTSHPNLGHGFPTRLPRTWSYCYNGKRRLSSLMLQKIFQGRHVCLRRQAEHFTEQLSDW